MKTLNAFTLEEMRASKEILANEIGVISNPSKKETAESIQKRADNPEEEGDPALVSTRGSVDGGNFRFKAAHFEWLLAFGGPLGLSIQ